MQLLRRLTEGDGHPLTRRLRALWGGDRPRLRAVDGGHAATPWGESHVPGHYWGEWTPESLRAAQMVWGHSLLGRSEEHTSELQTLMRTSYAVVCLKKKKPGDVRTCAGGPGANPRRVAQP